MTSSPKKMSLNDEYPEDEVGMALDLEEDLEDIE